MQPPSPPPLLSIYAMRQGAHRWSIAMHIPLPAPDEHIRKQEANQEEQDEQAQEDQEIRAERETICALLAFAQSWPFVAHRGRRSEWPGCQGLPARRAGRGGGQRPHRLPGVCACRRAVV